MEKTKVVGLTFIIIGLALMLHHCIFWQRIADLKDIMHHEFFEAIFFTAGITLLISACVKQNKRESEAK